MKVFLGRSREHTDQDDPIAFYRDHFSHRRVRIFITDHQVLPLHQFNTRFGVTQVGVSQAVAIGAVVVNP